MTVITTEDEKAGRAEQQLNLRLSPLDEQDPLTGLPTVRACRLQSLRYELDLVEPEEFAACIGVNVETLAGWRSAAQGPPYTKAGRTVFYRRADIRDWLDRSTVAPTIGTALAA